MKPQIEVIITFGRSRYKAVSPAFPHCSGTGKTTEIALENLGSSIGRFIGKASQKAIQSLFSNGESTEVIFDKTKKKGQTKKLFTMNPSQFSSSSSSLLSRRKSTESRMNTVLNLTNPFDSISPPSMAFDMDDPFDSETERSDDFSLGFPINLN